MKRHFLLAISFFIAANVSLAGPISIDVSTSYDKAGGIRAIRVNGKETKYGDAYRDLGVLLRASPAKEDQPVMVRIDEQCRFGDWDSVLGLMEKIGFSQDRYFITSKKTNSMCEIESLPSMPVSFNPPKSDSQHELWPYPISVEMKEDFHKTSAVWVNSAQLSQREAYDGLSDRLRYSEKHEKMPVIVLMSTECRFDDWFGIRRRLNKIGFKDVRYFVVSDVTDYMSELKLHSAIPISFNPPKSESR